jgi:hypothetical protein
MDNTGQRIDWAFCIKISRMFKHIFALCMLSVCAVVQGATINVSSWTPIFQGVDFASGQQIPTVAGERRHEVRCLRIDLSNTNVALFTTPHCTNNCGNETLAENPSHFLEQYGVQAAINCNFYNGSGGASDSPLGNPNDVLGLAITRGSVVSPNQTGSIFPHGYLLSVLMFTTNNQVVFVPSNNPPASISGIYTAIAGNESILVGGINYGDNTASDLDPRTAVGVSEDRQYLYMLTIDGRQSGWSDGANRHDTAEWLLRFGAYDAINVDGGGSTTMVMADCQGKSVRLNRSSFVAQYGRERNVGHNFGVYAKPLASGLKDLTVIPGATTALLTWRTDEPATTRVDYGPTLSYGSTNSGDDRLVRNHVATLTGLNQGSNYFFRAVSVAGDQELAQGCLFVTGKSLVSTQHFAITNSWTYTTNNLDGTNWKQRDYDDSGWLGAGPGLLYIESNTAVQPRNTPLPTIPLLRTYYFRTHFDFSGTTNGVSLVFSNYVDDGAVFYLNGGEIYRLRMPGAPTVIMNSTAATGGPCAGTAQSGDAAVQCPDIFTISGNLLTNLVQGDNVIAVETHNASTLTDIVFGSALFQNTPVILPPELNLFIEAGATTLFWNAEGFTLQQSLDVTSPANWTDVPGPITQSPFVVTNEATIFYRLRY